MPGKGKAEDSRQQYQSAGRAKGKCVSDFWEEVLSSAGARTEVFRKEQAEKAYQYKHFRVG